MPANGFLDAVGFNPASGGTGDFVVSAAATGFQTPASAGAVNGTVYSYRAQSADLSQWEIGYGSYTTGTTTLARTTVTASSTGSKVSFTSAPTVFITDSSADLQNAALLTNGQFGFHNRIINPSGSIWQRANTGTGALTDVTYAFDRWYVLTQSAGISGLIATGSFVGTPYMMRLNQDNATAQRFGICQAIETENCLDLLGLGVVLSADVMMSASTIMRYAIIEWTGTADSVTKDVVNSWTNGTFTPGNFFISTTTNIVATGSVSLTANALAKIVLPGVISTSMKNLLVFFWTDSAQPQNTAMYVGKVQLEIGTIPTPIALRDRSQEQNLCDRYYQSYGTQLQMQNPAGATRTCGAWRARLRTSPIVSGANTVAAVGSDQYGWTAVYSTTLVQITSADAEM